MVTIKVNYSVEREKEFQLTTAQWCEIHANSSDLREILAEANGVNKGNIAIKDGYSKIIEGVLDYENLNI